MTKTPQSKSASVIDRGNYKGRGQTYVKHLFLRSYLFALAFKVLQAPNIEPDLLYVDGFSGPWKSAAEKHTDTSFHIALTVLTDVANRLKERGITPRIRAIFVEKSPKSFVALSEAVKQFTAVETTVISGEFENTIPQIVAMVDGAFVFTFVDPTGWTGLALDRIAPLLRLRGEVLVNFMSYSLTRHIELPTVQASLTEFFGGPGWRDEYESALQVQESEDAARVTYLARLKSICKFTYAGTTRVRFEDKHRTYFHLVYGTRHPEGMNVFRDSEKSALATQEELAYDSIINKSSRKVGTGNLLADIEDPNLRVFQRWESSSQAKAEREFQDWLNNGEPMDEYRRAALLMEHPHVHRAFVRTMVAQAEQDGALVKRVAGRRIMLCPRRWLDANKG